MKLSVMRERHPGETRVALTPANISTLTNLGCEVFVETGAGDAAPVCRSGLAVCRSGLARPMLRLGLVGLSKTYVGNSNKFIGISKTF